MKVVFVGAGPGSVELLTLRGKREIETADVIIYSGSLVNEEILKYAKKDAVIINSYGKTREEIFKLYEHYTKIGKKVVRLHSGDPSLYSTLQEQLEFLQSKNIEYEIVPGVSSISAAAAALKRELTSPGVSQTVILTQPGSKTDLPSNESISELSKHGATMVIFLGVHLIDRIVPELLSGGKYSPETPVAVVHKASWDEEKIITGTLGDIAEKVRAENIGSQALIIVGDVLKKSGKKSKVYGG